MSTSTKKVIPKKRGRPATGKDPLIGFRSPPALTAKIDAIAEILSIPTRSNAVRRLVELGVGRVEALLGEEADSGVVREILEKR